MNPNLRPLKEKLSDENYIKNLSERKRKELYLIRNMLTDQELESLSSIRVAYRIARTKFVTTYLPKEVQDEYLYNKRPLFTEILKNVFRRSIEDDA